MGNPEWTDENFNFACEDDDFLDYTLVFQLWDTGFGPDVELGEGSCPSRLSPSTRMERIRLNLSFLSESKTARRAWATSPSALKCFPSLAGWAKRPRAFGHGPR